MDYVLHLQGRKTGFHRPYFPSVQNYWNCDDSFSSLQQHDWDDGFEFFANRSPRPMKTLLVEGRPGEHVCTFVFEGQWTHHHSAWQPPMKVFCRNGMQLMCIHPFVGTNCQNQSKKHSWLSQVLQNVSWVRSDHKNNPISSTKPEKSEEKKLQPVQQSGGLALRTWVCKEREQRKWVVDIKQKKLATLQVKTTEESESIPLRAKKPKIKLWRELKNGEDNPQEQLNQSVARENEV